jgi:ribonuclease P protein component
MREKNARALETLAREVAATPRARTRSDPRRDPAGARAGAAYTGSNPGPGPVSDETHVSAEEAQASAYARIPRADAHARRAHHAQTPARQRPQATRGLMLGPRGARPRPGRSRLSRSADFDRVFRQGRSHAGRELVLYVFPRKAEGGPRLGLSVSRKVGGAVQRNQVKRLLREAFAVEGNRLPPGTDAVVVARREAHALAEREGLTGVRSALAELISRAGGAEPEVERQREMAS